jgi:hypothetical protein
MKRFVIPATMGDAVACPNCGLVHRHVRTRRRDPNELNCDCGAIIVLAANITADVIVSMDNERI